MRRKDWQDMSASEREAELATRAALFGAPLRLDLPWPPSLNSYWRSVNGRNILSQEGRAYRHRVAEAVRLQDRHRFATGPIAVHITAHPPDRRRRDLDNMLKGVLDALAKTGVYGDDSQIDDLHIVRGAQATDGLLVVEVSRR